MKTIGLLRQKKSLDLHFSSGTDNLNFADRYWVTYDNDIVEALFGAINSLNQEGFSTCTVTAGTKASPDLSAQNIWIMCGEKSVLVTRQTIDGKSHNMVYEQLGGILDSIFLCSRTRN